MKIFSFAMAIALTSCLVLKGAEEDDEPAEDESAQTTTEAKESVSFDGQTLELAFEGDNPGSRIKEYLLPGEKLERWTKLAAIHEFPELKDRKEYAKSLVNTLKQQYPDSPSAIIEDPKTGDVIVDFVVWPKDGSFVEFNIFRCEKNPEGGLIAKQYALREYKETEQFLRDLKPLRLRLLNLMATEGLTELAVESDEAS
jgi:hypothetical protein